MSIDISMAANGSQATIAGRLTINGALRLIGGLAVATLPILMDRNAVQTAAALYPLASSASPYFVPEYAGLLYFRAPLVVISAFVLVMAPGLLLALALDQAHTIGQWVLRGFTISLIAVSLVAASVQAINGQPLQGDGFVLVLIVSALVAASVLVVVAGRRTIASPFAQTFARLDLLGMIVFAAVILMALAPKFYWENFNGDGANAFESTRLLLHQPFPFWTPSAGEVAFFPGITSALFAYPAAWFIRLFGEVETSVRIPFVLYLVVLYAVVLELIDRNAEPLKPSGRFLLYLSLTSFALAVAYSATYSPYSADIALPATQDTLLVICFLGFGLAYLAQETLWTYVFLWLTLLSLPNGLILVGFWLVAVVLITRPRSWRPIYRTLAAIVAFMGFAAVAPLVLRWLHQPPPGTEYSLVRALAQFAFFQFSDVRRFLFMLVPTGLVPALFLLAWRWQDQTARLFTLVSGLYFCFFYVQAHIALHYFIPVMILPLIVFWRIPQIRQALNSRIAVSGLAMAGLVAVILSAPRQFTIDSSGRTVGTAIEINVPGYAQSSPDVFQGSTLLQRVFPYDWDPLVPAQSYGGSALVWIYYANHRPPNASTNYWVQSIHETPPGDMRLLAQENELAVYVRDSQLWQTHRALRPPTPAGSAIYRIPRSSLFGLAALGDGPMVFSVLDIAKRLGINLDRLVQRLRSIQ